MGTLYLVATPIGNLDDMTYRAVQTLRDVSTIAAEDTRIARRLLNHYNIDTPLTSFHGDSSDYAVARLAAKLESADIAIISDAGMPGISDPGSELIRHAIEIDASIIPIPGPSAVVAAAAASGQTDRGFVFAGYLPRKPGARRRTLIELLQNDLPLIVFEAPGRVRELLEDLKGIDETANVTVGREITKLHEEWLRGTPSTVLQNLIERGEFTLVIERGLNRDDANRDELDNVLRNAFKSGSSLRDAVDRGMAATGIGRREVYRRALELHEETRR